MKYEDNGGHNTTAGALYFIYNEAWNNSNGP